MAELDYTTIDPAYNDLLERTDTDETSSVFSAADSVYNDTSVTEPSASQSSGSSTGNVETQVVKSSGGIGDIWITSFIKSMNYKPKSQGFMIDGPRGYIEATNVWVSGSISATSGRFGGWYIQPGALSSDVVISSSEILLDANNKLIRVGKNLSSSDVFILIDGQSASIRSSDYVSGTTGNGFLISSNLIESGNVAIRGTIRSAVFQKNVTSSVGGDLMVINSDVLDEDMTPLNDSTIKIKGSSTFQLNDILRIKTDTNDEWFKVTSIDSAPIYEVLRDRALFYPSDLKPAWPKGSTVVSYGQNGAGGVFMTASETNAPYLSIFTHGGSPWDTTSTKVRLGNLNGLTNPVDGSILNNIYGLWTDNAYLSGTIVANSGKIGGWIVDNTSIKDTSGFVGLSSAISGGDDIRFWAGNSTPASAPFRVTESGALYATNATLQGTIKTATYGQRIEMSTSSLNFYDENGAASGSIIGSSTEFGDYINVTGRGNGAYKNATITAYKTIRFVSDRGTGSALREVRFFNAIDTPWAVPDLADGVFGPVASGNYNLGGGAETDYSWSRLYLKTGVYYTGGTSVYPVPRLSKTWSFRISYQGNMSGSKPTSAAAWSCSRIGTGTYQVTHTAGTFDYQVIAQVNVAGTQVAAPSLGPNEPGTSWLVLVNQRNSDIFAICTYAWDGTRWVLKSLSDFGTTYCIDVIISFY
jgi:hypothetical protein